MPSSRTFEEVEEEEDAVPLSDLLRTGEASRLRRRGAMRGAHRREDSEESMLPPSRRVRVEPPSQHRGPRDDQVLLELSCGVRTSHFSTQSSSPSLPGPLPQTRHSSQSSELGFVYASTGCDTVINSAAFPSQPGCSGAQQVYISTDTSNSEVARLPSRYLDAGQRSIAEFLSRDDTSCKCDWEAIGCRVCGNSLGFLFIPCHSGHSVDIHRAGAQPTYVFFPSSVTPSPSHIFPPIDPALYGSLPPLAPPSDTDDMSIDSPTFSPRVQIVQDDAVAFRLHPPYPRAVDVFDFSRNEPNPSLTANAPGSPTTPTNLPSSTLSEERFPDYSQAESGNERPVSNHPWSSQDSRPYSTVRYSETRGQSSSSRMGTRYSHPVAPRPRDPSDDEWNAFFDRDHVPSSLRRYEEQSERTPLHPWVPRELRERPPGALAPGERAADRLATITYPEPERIVPQFTVGAASPARAPDPPTLHRVPRRSLGSLAPPNRRLSSFDSLSWRPRTATAGPMPPGPSRNPYASERPEHPRDGERGLRMSRWASMPNATTHPRRRPTPSTSTSTPAFTLVDSMGERSYPPSAQSSLDEHDTLSVDTSPDISWGSRGYLLPGEVNFGGDGRFWGNAVHTEEPEMDDEEKADEEQRTNEPLVRERSPYIVHNRELVLDEQSVSSVSRLPLG